MHPRIRNFALFTASIVLVAATSSSRRGIAAEPERVPLFDGKSLAGWVNLDGEPKASGWRAADGVLEFRGRGETIMTAEEFGDFDLRFEWKISRGGNSGLKYKFKRFGRSWLGCEYQVLDDERHGDGRRGRTSTASLYHVCEPDPEKKRLNPPGEWNSGRVVVKGSRIEHWLNGEKVLSIDTDSEEWKERIAKSKFSDVDGFGRNERGRIMLQDHGSHVWFRNITIARLDREVPEESAASSSGKVKVFILAGQSNMEGKAKLELLEHQVAAPETRERFAHLRKDGGWVERDDVWIEFLGRRGKLSVGFGSPGCIGPELEFGNTVGDRFDEPVLLIKTAWGGKSLGRDFRPPTSGLPSEEKLARILEQTNARNRERNRPEIALEDVKASYGAYYRSMLEEVRTTLAGIETRFPEYRGQGWEIAGFVWFQGWNDMFDPDFLAEYDRHLANLIRDVRKDLDAPGLPFVIGQMGQGGPDGASDKVQAIKEAQAKVGELPEFQGNVEVVATDVFWDRKAAALVENWRDHIEEWKKVGSDYGYHYLGSAITFSEIGRAFGRAMLELLRSE